MKKQAIPLQQGDVILRPITLEKSKLKKAERIKPASRGHVLAEGEATGHYHAIEEIDDAELIRIGEQMLLSVKESVTVKHEEHGAITIPPGLYEVDRVREYDYLNEMTRRVAD